MATIRETLAYTPDNGQYEAMKYRRCGRSGLQLPVVSLGLWHNFGGISSFRTWKIHHQACF